ncbi:hypothetical protein Tco_1425154, partial [Tanacetum coccineum]
MYFHHSIFLTPTSTSSDGVWPCLFREFSLLLAAWWKVANKGIARLVSHLKRLYLPSDESKCVLREAISTNHGLYMAVEETLKAFGQWLCGKCMDLHVVSRICHHPDGLVRFSKGSDDMSGYIVSISRPSNKVPGTEVTEGLVLDAELVDRVFKVLITTVKSIHHGCRLTFSQALKAVLCKVVVQPDSVDVWVSQVTGYMRKDDSLTTLVKSILDDFALGSFGHGGEIDSVFGCIKSFPKDTSCGIDGLRAQHILDALYEEGSAAATDFLNVITSAVNLWLAERCLSILVAMKGVGKEMSKYLSDFQFGVGVSGGVEVVLHSVNRVLCEYHNYGSFAMLNVDFTNAFNLVDRSALLHEVKVMCPSVSLWVDFLYGQAPRFYIRDTHSWSATGVQQDSEEVAMVLDIIKVSVLGLAFLSSGVRLIGGAVSTNTDFISGLVIRRAANAVDLMSLLPQLHD